MKRKKILVFCLLVWIYRKENVIILSESVHDLYVFIFPTCLNVTFDGFVFKKIDLMHFEN